MANDAFLVIGSGPGAVAAAVAYREAGGAGPVRIVSADPDLPYDRPPLSKDLLQGDSGPADAITHPASFYDEHDIDLVLGVTVNDLDVSGRSAGLSDGRRVGFTSCVLATGAAPVRPPVPGADLDHVHVLRSLRDALALRADAEQVSTAVVVGSGFIGCEAAASLASRGVHVTLVTSDELPHQDRLGTWVAGRVAGWLREQGVELVTGDEISAITDDPAARVRTRSGRVLAAGLVVLATGVAPQVLLAENAGLDLTDGRIRVDASMRTSAPGVFAVGDAALATNAAAGRAIRVEHWGDAMTMGEIAGRVAAGQDATWDQAPGFWSTIGERTLKYSAWGDGHDEVRVHETDAGFTVWYAKQGRVVGVLTHEADEDYERGAELVEQSASAESLPGERVSS